MSGIDNTKNNMEARAGVPEEDPNKYINFGGKVIKKEDKQLSWGKSGAIEGPILVWGKVVLKEPNPTNSNKNQTFKVTFCTYSGFLDFKIKTIVKVPFTSSLEQRASIIFGPSEVSNTIKLIVIPSLIVKKLL